MRQNFRTWPRSRSPNYSFDHAGIRDRVALDMIFAAYDPKAIMYLADESRVDRSIDGPGAFFETNFTGTFNVLEAARAYWARQDTPEGFLFHHILTDEVFGLLGAIQKLTEEMPYNPHSPYLVSKAASDRLVRAWGETYRLPVILNALHERPIPVCGAGENLRDLLYLEEHTRADRPGHDARYAIDPARIRTELGLRPSATLEEGLRKTARGLLDNQTWWQPLLERQVVGQRLGVSK